MIQILRMMNSKRLRMLGRIGEVNVLDKRMSLFSPSPQPSIFPYLTFPRFHVCMPRLQEISFWLRADLSRCVYRIWEKKYGKNAKHVLKAQQTDSSHMTPQRDGSSMRGARGGMRGRGDFSNRGERGGRGGSTRGGYNGAPPPPQDGGWPSRPPPPQDRKSVV